MHTLAMFLRTLSTLALIAALPATALAQQPAAWADLAVPTGVDPTRLESRGKLVTYRDGNIMRVFSASQREWQTIAATPGAPARLMNDCVLLQDGTTWTAFSAYTGAFAPLTVSPTAQLLNPSGQNNDSILLVLDGVTLHAFSCFVGTWISRPVSNTAVFAVQRHVAVLADGTLLGGMDAYTGQWLDTTVASPPQVLDCDGIAGLASDATHMHAFSAVHRTWLTSALGAGSFFARGDDWALHWNAGFIIAYSGLTGTLTSISHGASAVPFRRDLLALIDSPIGLRAYSAIGNSLSPIIASSSATVRASEATAILVDGQQVTGYSAVTSTFSTITMNSSAEAVANTVATAVDNATGQPWCYSALTGTWHQPPADVLPGIPQVTGTSILLPATSGAYAFSARTGNFIPLAGPGLVLVGNDQSAIGAAWDNGMLHAFDARTDSWRSVSRSSTGAPIVQIWRTSMFVIDGPTVHGFGAQNGTWTSTVLPEPFVTGRANSESSRVVTATHVLAHAPVPVTLSTAQFPEFRRVQPTGGTARFSVALDGGGVAILAGGVFGAGPTAVPGFGDFWLAAPLATVLLVSVPGAERATFDLPVPYALWLQRTQLAFQSLALPAIGTPHLGEAIGLYLL